MSKDPKSGIVLAGLRTASPGLRGSLNRKAEEATEGLINHVGS